jgi:tetratricopeptide (TPR) repeat protein
MSTDPPHSPLITPDLRRRLQQRYEEAVRVLNQRPVDHARIHELLAECLRTDPGNILYLDALLANLRQWQPRRNQGNGGWLSRWMGTSRGARATSPASTEYSVLSTQYSADEPLDEAAAQALLRRAPDLLQSQQEHGLLLGLAAAAAAGELDQAEIRYLRYAASLAPDNSRTLGLLARALTRQGQFEEAARLWQTLLAKGPDAEARQAADDLREAAAQESADQALAEASAAAGEDLGIRRDREDLRLLHAQQQVTMARRRAASDPHPKAQALAIQFEAEQLRQEIEILHLRCERLPGDKSLRLQLARKLKQAGNFSGAILRLEEAKDNPALAAEVLLELGECWQHLRQFEKALDFYRQAIAATDGMPEPRPMVVALYRVGVLTAAMGKTAEAREALTRLAAIEPGYKDARERLDKLPPN